MEREFEMEMLAIVSSLNRIEGALEGLQQLVDDLESRVETEATGGVAIPTLPKWVRGALPVLGSAEINLDNVRTAIEEADEALREFDSEFRQEMKDGFDFEYNELADQYYGDYGDRRYLDERDQYEMDEFFRQRGMPDE